MGASGFDKPDVQGRSEGMGMSSPNDKADGRGTPRTVQPHVRVRRSLWLWIKTHIEEEIEDEDMRLHAEDTVASARSLLREINEVPVDGANAANQASNEVR